MYSKIKLGDEKNTKIIREFLKSSTASVITVIAKGIMNKGDGVGFDIGKLMTSEITKLMQNALKENIDNPYIQSLGGYFIDIAGAAISSSINAVIDSAGTGLVASPAYLFKFQAELVLQMGLITAKKVYDVVDVGLEILKMNAQNHRQQAGGIVLLAEAKSRIEYQRSIGKYQQAETSERNVYNVRQKFRYDNLYAEQYHYRSDFIYEAEDILASAFIAKTDNKPAQVHELMKLLFSKHVKLESDISYIEKMNEELGLLDKDSLKVYIDNYPHVKSSNFFDRFLGLPKAN